VSRRSSIEVAADTSRAVGAVNGLPTW
jgi:hypothetical protein